MRPLSRKEKDAICIALGCRNNIIETGDYSVGAADVKRIGAENAAKGGITVKSLNVDQMELILLARELMTKALNGKIHIQD